MKRVNILIVFTGIFLLCHLSFFAKASEGIPTCILNRERVAFIRKMLPDTIPAPVKTVEAPATKPVAEKPVASVIKAVPKARRVAVPKPVTVKLTPVKIIKPKIIKPVLKVL
jgi:hypothetical protein